MNRRIFVALFSLLLFAGPVVAAQPASPAPATPGAGQGGFVPVGQAPATEQLPAAPLLITAYAFVWLALAAYLWSIWRRLGKVEAEMQALDRRMQRGGAR
jgi:CcmD family protein